MSEETGISHALWGAVPLRATVYSSDPRAPARSTPVIVVMHEISHLLGCCVGPEAIQPPDPSAGQWITCQPVGIMCGDNSALDTWPTRFSARELMQMGLRP